MVSDTNYSLRFFVEVANMLYHIAPEIKITINRPNRFSFIWFKLHNRHLNNIKFSKNPVATSEFYEVYEFMEKEFTPQLQGDFFGKIYKTNFERKAKKLFINFILMARLQKMDMKELMVDMVGL